MRQLDISGRKFGKLTAIEFAYVRKGNYYWKFRCVCGKVVTRVKSEAVRDKLKNCGCESRRTLKGGIYSGTYAKFRSPLQAAYTNLLSRCYNQKNNHYHRYGGRGIKNRWRSFADFEQDMKDDYWEHVSKHGKNNTTIERIDNDGDYSKKNCKWTTRREQLRNTSRNRFIEFDGKKLCIADWANLIGHTSAAIDIRIKKGRALAEVLSEDRLYIENRSRGKQFQTAHNFSLNKDKNELMEKLSVMMVKRPIIFNQMIEYLNNRERNILIDRLDLSTGHRKALIDLVQKYSVSYQRIAQIENAALKKIMKII